MSIKGVNHERPVEMDLHQSCGLGYFGHNRIRLFSRIGSGLKKFGFNYQIHIIYVAINLCF